MNNKYSVVINMGRHIMMVLCLAFIALGLGIPTWATESVSGPHIVVSEPSHDFMTVLEGAILEHTFILSNTGDQVLEVANVENF